MASSTISVSENASLSILAVCMSPPPITLKVIFFPNSIFFPPSLPRWMGRRDGSWKEAILFFTRLIPVVSICSCWVRMPSPARRFADERPQCGCLQVLQRLRTELLPELCQRGCIGNIMIHRGEPAEHLESDVRFQTTNEILIALPEDMLGNLQSHHHPQRL